MKKSVKIICLIVFILAFLFLATDITKAVTVIGKAITGETVTGEAVTGEATRLLNMNITVLAPPTLSIISPESRTYLINSSLLLNYSVSGQGSIWYNLDNLENTTITSYIHFNASQGAHTLYLYANNSQGTTSRNVTFSVNITKILIIDDETDDDDDDDDERGYNKREQKKGESTDFYDYSYDEIQNLSGIIFDNPGQGKIQFNQAINLTDDANPADNIINIDSNVNISFKRIEINSTALPNFNKSATLWFYNLTFTNPHILKNGEVCPSSICTKESYSNGVLKFNVTDFSIYSAEETPATSTSTASSSGGGGEEKAEEISLDKYEITIRLKQGETKKEEITITNKGNKRIKIGLSFSGEEFAKVNKTSFELNAKESEKVILDFIARENTPPNLYLGKLIVKSENTEKEVLISVEVETKKPVFDVNLEIPEEFQAVAPGGEILARISLYNLGEIKRADVIIDYIIKDRKGNIIVSKKETMTIETKVSFIKSIKLPENAKYGPYIFYTKVTYNNETAIASAEFSVGEVEKPFLTRENIFLFVIIIVIIVLIFLLIELKVLKKIYKKPSEKRKGKNSLESLTPEVQSA